MNILVWVGEPEERPSGTAKGGRAAKCWALNCECAKTRSR